MIIILCAGLILLACAGPVRLHKARKAADEYAVSQGIETHYAVGDQISSREYLLNEIVKLAEWEQKTRTGINEAFHYTDKEYETRDTQSKSGYEKEEELLSFAMKEKWRKLRGSLEDGVEEAVLAVFEKSGKSYGLDQQAVLTCYKKGRFPKIREVMQAVEKGAGLEAYSLARYGLEEDWSALPMDIAYGLRPKLIRAGCEADLLSAVKSNELYEVSRAVGSAESFEKRYNAGIDGLKSAKAKEERLEYANRPDVPAVGMSTSQARSTKLGAPTRTTTEHGSWSHKKHTYGDMVWEKGGRQIFRAHYFDGEIQDIYDTRNSTATSPWASSRKSSSSSKPSFDPDDHDIEAYYEDNRDEYEDYDDAYDGFLDDEGAWDDY